MYPQLPWSLHRNIFPGTILYQLHSGLRAIRAQPYLVLLSLVHKVNSRVGAAFIGRLRKYGVISATCNSLLLSFAQR